MNPGPSQTFAQAFRGAVLEHPAVNEAVAAVGDVPDHELAWRDFALQGAVATWRSCAFFPLSDDFPEGEDFGCRHPDHLPTLGMEDGSAVAAGYGGYWDAYAAKRNLLRRAFAPVYGAFFDDLRSGKLLMEGIITSSFGKSTEIAPATWNRRDLFVVIRDGNITRRGQIQVHALTGFVSGAERDPGGRKPYPFAKVLAHLTVELAGMELKEQPQSGADLAALFVKIGKREFPGQALSPERAAQLLRDEAPPLWELYKATTRKTPTRK